MIVVRVELHSVITGEVTEIAKMHICNESHLCGQEDPKNYGSYGVYAMRGRDKAALDKNVVQRQGKFGQYPRLRLHVWNLVLCALVAAGYKGYKGEAA